MRLATVTLVVPDYDAAIAFFTGALRFAVAEDTPLAPPKRWVVLRPPGGGADLLLARAAGAVQAAAIGRQAGGRVAFFLETDRFDADLARLARHGVPAAPVRREPYGRVTVFTDPWGNRWDLIEPA